MSDSTKGYLLGALGVLIFAVTLPMTKLAISGGGAGGLSPLFVTLGRAAVAGLCSVVYLAVTRAPLPTREQAFWLVVTGLGNVIGFPLFLALGVKHVDAIHASVVTGALPLATAAFAALWLGQRASFRFWALAVFGFALIVLYAWLSGGEGGFSPADGLLLLAVLSASASYALGARLSREMKAEHVICWILVFFLPIMAPAAWWIAPTAPVAPIAWLGFAYVALFSMWLGFFAWYRGLALGGAMRVSQIQLAQPFLSMIFAVPILGEDLTLLSMVFCLAIIATVALSRKAR
ncbi:MAG: DMT family transporter [Proteobacteria bacterium]|nr:DMT family transporter [Pseudomonadota bacterium]